MTRAEDPLRDALRRLAVEVADADLYDPALRRSRRLAHRRAAAGTVTALTALGLTCAGLWCLAPPGGHAGSPRPTRLAEQAPAVRYTAAPVPLPATVAPTTRPARPTPVTRLHPTRSHTAVPRSRSLADLPGEVFYDQRGDEPRVIRLDGDGSTETVLSAPHSALGISPDGSKIAYVEDGTLLVRATAGGLPEQPYEGAVSDQQAPVWSPAGDKLLIDAAEPAVLDVADGTLSALPLDLDGRYFRWSGDGRKVVFATPACRLKVAELASAGLTTAEPAVTVPTVGDPEIPGGQGACRPISVDATGRRVAVPLQPGGAPDDGSAVANAVVDTATGTTAVLPVGGVVIGAVFDAGGCLLVRAVDQGHTTLSLFSPSEVLLVQAREPSGLSGLDLVAYTH